MALPPPSSGDVTWRDYKIDTPTFDLTPIEKPDMSPFLFHMTGKRAILDILRATGAPNNPAAHGLLRAVTPETSGDNYHAQVVCFSESPVFALDFFRHRSFRRWQQDTRFGIGFSKSELSSLEVRPCIYASETLKNQIVSFRNRIENGETVDERSVALIEELYPLTSPLLENSPTQGFMWEREWRFTEPEGFTFPYDAIRVICCPESEEQALREILGDYANNISFVRTWSEYDEVTDYLRRRSETATTATTPAEFRRAIQKNKQLSHNLEAYKELAGRLANLIPELETELEQRRKTLQELEAGAKALEDKI